MVRQRQSDRAPKDLYYFAAFEPTATQSQFCGRGCVMGLCGLASSPSDSSSRACIGVGFPGDTSATTMAHEVGHAHGRMHAPCGNAAQPDPAYPYQGGGTGVWGWDITKKQLKSPASNKDLMGYCQPTWISDYIYGKLFERMAFVARSSILLPAGNRYFRFVNVAGDGSLTWGERFLATDAPLSEPVTIAFKTPDRGVLESAIGYFYPYDHLPGGYLLVPDGPSESAAITIAALDGRFPRTTLRLPAE